MVVFRIGPKNRIEYIYIYIYIYIKRIKISYKLICSNSNHSNKVIYVFKICEKHAFLLILLKKHMLLIIETRVTITQKTRVTSTQKTIVTI
jgi:hypothetical protein